MRQGHVGSSSVRQHTHERKGGSALRDKALWVTGLVSEVNAYTIPTPLNFLSGKNPELLKMYIGEFEANIWQVFQRESGAHP